MSTPFSRRSFLKGAAATAAAGTLLTHNSPSATAQPLSGTTTHPLTNNSPGTWKVGCGLADMTGACAGQGMMGFAAAQQIAMGIRQRYFARAFIFIDPASQQRLVYVNVDMACFFEEIRVQVLENLQRKFGNLYPSERLCITATHNHNSCGGTSSSWAYNMSSKGFRQNSFDAEVTGITEAIERAHKNIRPAELFLGRSELWNASVNRSPSAFARNPQADKDYYPHAIDPRVTVLRIKQSGKDVGAITWFATHGTSMTEQNRYLSPDNKGLAAYYWEHGMHGVDYLSDDIPFVSAFSQTNTGDLTPSLFAEWLDPKGPTEDNILNAHIIGKRQLKACQRAWESAVPLTGSGLEVAFSHFTMANQKVSGRFTADGKDSRTTHAVMGWTAAAASLEDNHYSQTWPLMKEGDKDPLAPLWQALDNTEVPRSDFSLQAPKINLLPLGYTFPKGVTEVLPLQIIRLGDLYLICAPAEFTQVAGLRVRRVVAQELGVDLEQTIFQGYSNSYNQYVTTPEEYLDQQYEGGETLYGVETLGLYKQNFHYLATCLKAHKPAPKGSDIEIPWGSMDTLPKVPADTAPKGKKFGDVLVQPQAFYYPGNRVTVDFVGGHPNNNVRRGGTYHEVQRWEKGRWVRVYDDTTAETMFHWERPEKSRSESINRVRWIIPNDCPAGRYRVVHYGDSRDKRGVITPYTGISRTFQVRKQTY